MDIQIKDTYQSIAEESKGIFKDRGSKFLSFAYPIISEDQARQYLLQLKKEYYDARHHCYAYCLGVDRSIFRMNDDGEPSGTGGKPIHGQFLSFDISDVLIVVVRYFGGTLLGTGGLINAYRSAASDALMNATIIEKTIEQEFDISFPFELTNDVYRVIHDENARQINLVYESDCRMTLAIRKNNYEKILNRLSRIYGVEFHQPA